MKIKKVYDYKANGTILPNALNTDFLRLFVKYDYDTSSGLLDEFTQTYKDGINSWDLEGVLIDNCILDESISTNDVALGENCSNDDLYLYVVTPYGGASSSYGYGGTYSDGRSFFYFIPEVTKKMIKEKDNFYLMINYGNEGTLDRFWFNIIHHDANYFDIPLDKIVFVVSDFTIKETYDDYCEENEFTGKIKVFPILWSLKSKSNEYNKIYNNQATTFNNYENECSICKEEDIELDEERTKHFLMFNRRLRPHRYYSILLFNKLNILDKFYISYDFENCKPYHFDEEGYTYHGTDEEFRDELLEENKKVENGLLTKSIIDYDDLVNVWGFNFEKKEPYLDSYIHITAETNFFERGLYLSEKTWKPMAQLQPFIMMGAANSLELIKSLGFKTFDGFIDESYDKIENNEERFKAILAEIERLSNIPLHELKDWYKSIFNDILLHNQNLILRYDNIDSKDTRNEFLRLFK